MINWWSVLIFSIMILAAAIHLQRAVKLVISYVKIYKSTKAWSRFRSVKI